MVIQVRGLSGEESYNLECFSDCVATCHPNPTSYSLTCFRPEGAAEQAAQTTLICSFHGADEANVLANGCLCIRPTRSDISIRSESCLRPPYECELNIHSPLGGFSVPEDS